MLYKTLRCFINYGINTDLDLSVNKITDLTPLADLRNLTRLSLNANRICDITPLSDLLDLAVLDLSKNRISDITALAHHDKLEWLHLDYTSIENEKIAWLKSQLPHCHIACNNNQRSVQETSVFN